MNEDFLNFMDREYLEIEDEEFSSSLTIDSSFLTSSLLRESQPYLGEILKEPKPFSFPKYIPFTLLNNSNIISEEEVYLILYGKDKNVSERNPDLDESDEKENNQNITNRVIKKSTEEFALQSIYLKASPTPLISKTDPKYIINTDFMDQSRTTCMIKNIPNKYTQKMLINLLNEHHFGCFDFVYLRMDFKNKCNVGYAFVNFIKIEYIKSFYNKINNKGWKLFSSNKIAELTYASIQGFDNLVNKFRHSIVMKEQESYRPKIFFREGKLKGHENPNF